MQRPWLSILMPVYRVGEALDECLRSIFDQQADGFEGILVSDGCDAEETARMRAWAARHPASMRIVDHPTNLGVSAARNTLLGAARGAYLWFFDPDDIMEPGALARLERLLAEQRPDLVMCDFRTFDDVPVPASGVPASSVHRSHVRVFEGASEVLSHSREALVAGLFRTGQFHPWSKIVRRGAWPSGLVFPVGRVFEDLAVFPRVALGAATHWHVPQVWVSYRQRARSLLSSLDEKKLDDWTLALSGFAGDLRASSLRQDPRMVFEVSHFCARTLLRAVRRHDRLAPWPGAAQRLRNYVDRWRLSSPMDADQLARAYLARGMLGRWAQWLWTMQRLARRSRAT